MLSIDKKTFKFVFIILFSSVLLCQDKLPDAFLKSLDKKKVSIKELHNNGPMAINFWFLACDPCKKEMKFLNEFHQKYAESGFIVVSVITDISLNPHGFMLSRTIGIPEGDDMFCIPVDIINP